MSLGFVARTVDDADTLAHSNKVGLQEILQHADSSAEQVQSRSGQGNQQYCALGVGQQWLRQWRTGKDSPDRGVAHFNRPSLP